MPFTETLLDVSHHFGWKAFWISVLYDTVRPAVTSAMPPSSLSVELTFWRPSGLRASSFLPTSWNARPAADISTSFRTGPTAWDAGLAFAIWMLTCAGIPLELTCQTRAPLSRLPNGFTPLNSGWARPFQKLRWLKTALITDGVFLPVTRRTFLPPTLNTGSATEEVDSTPFALTPTNVVLRTPCEPTMSSELACEAVSGKSPAVRLAFEAKSSNAPLGPGLIWFFARVSAPAWK